MGDTKTVRCKFQCQAVSKRKHWDEKKGFLFSADFTPVTSGSPEDTAFWEATPCGKLEVSSFKGDLFEPGKTYYLDITPAPVEG